MKFFVKSRKIAVPIVVDTNILVPSLYMTTPLFNFVLSGNIILIWNEFMRFEAHEIIDRLARRYIEKADVSDSEVHDLLNFILRQNSKVPEMPNEWLPHSPDRDDDPFLWAAIAGKAEYIISSDVRHMLKLKNIYGIPIGKPKEFFDWVKIAYPMP